MDGNTPTMMQSEKERAPWNERPNTFVNLQVNVQCVLQKENVDIYTDDYIVDTDGSKCLDYTDWEAAYKKSRFTIPQLLDVLKEYVQKELKDDKVVKTKFQEERLKRILDDCNGWVASEESYNEA